MGSSTDFTTSHQRDIHGYYLALQTFFEVTEVKHDRSTSPRAQKARAKLLKLSASQFYELSTDVYDELQRRISEDKSQPDYLLPKVSFHIKRNQARQKLANLSQTRFNDLVDDILFEIRRRGYDDVNPETTNESRTKSNEDTEYDRSTNTTSANQSNGNTIHSISDGSSVKVPPTATIQASQVIPKKASIDWSSDEEDVDSEPARKPDQANSSESVVGDKISHGFSNPTLTPVTKTFTDNYHYMDLNESPVENGLRDLTEKNSFQETSENTKDFSDPEIVNSPERLERLQHNLDEVQETNESLNAEVEKLTREIKVLRNENSAFKAMGSKGKDVGSLASNANFQEELTSLSSQVSILSIENENLKQQISEMELKAKHVGPSKSEETSTNFLDILHNKYPLDRHSISKYIMEDGCVPFEIIQHLHDQISLLFIKVESAAGDLGKELFEILARVSDAIHQMLVLVDVPEFKDEVILLKASLSHTITSIRYFSVYNPLLPKITVQAALSDLAFSICNLINSSKIKLDGPKDKGENSQQLKKSDSETKFVPRTPIVSEFSSRLSQELLQKPGDISVSDDTKDDMSPVKPLKITQRANVSPSSTLKPSSSRKASGSLFFSSMIDTKSPLSSSRSSKIVAKSPHEQSNDTNEENKRHPIQDSKSKNGNLSGKIKVSDAETELITPTKSVNNSTVEVVDGTPSLPTPTAPASKSTPKPLERGKSSLEASTNGSANEQAKEVIPLKQKTREDRTPNRSFTEKLKNFANNTGIGLRVEKEPKKLENQSQSNQSQVNKPEVKEQEAKKPEAKNPEVKEPKVKEPQAEAQQVEGAMTGELNGKTVEMHEVPPRKRSDSFRINSLKTEESDKGKNPTKSFKAEYSALKPPEVNPTPSKLTDKFKKTFEDMSDIDSENDTKSELNDSSNFSDDGSTYLALKQSLRKKTDPSSNEPRIVKKATVYSPRAQQDSQFNDSETKFSTDTDLSDAPSEHSLEKKSSTISKAYPSSFTRGLSLESRSLRKIDNSVLKSEEPKELSLNEAPFDEDLNLNKVKKEELDENSDYQFVPLRREDSVEEERVASNAHGNAKATERRVDQVDEDNDVHFDFDAFDIKNPDNTLSELLLYLEHQTVQVISTIQSLLSSIKEPQATKGNLRVESNAINQVIRQMVDATSISMNQSRNASLKEHGTWVVKSLEDCSLRMITLCQLTREGEISIIKGDEEFADKHFKQRLAGIAFDVAKCTKELVKTVEEASLKEEIAFLNSRLN